MPTKIKPRRSSFGLDPVTKARRFVASRGFAAEVGGLSPSQALQLAEKLKIAEGALLTRRSAEVKNAQQGRMDAAWLEGLERDREWLGANGHPVPAANRVIREHAARLRYEAEREAFWTTLRERREVRTRLEVRAKDACRRCHVPKGWGPQPHVCPDVSSRLAHGTTRSVCSTCGAIADEPYAPETVVARVLESRPCECREGAQRHVVAVRYPLAFGQMPGRNVLDEDKPRRGAEGRPHGNFGIRRLPDRRQRTEGQGTGAGQPEPQRADEQDHGRDPVDVVDDQGVRGDPPRS